MFTNAAYKGKVTHYFIYRGVRETIKNHPICWVVRLFRRLALMGCDIFAQEARVDDIYL